MNQEYFNLISEKLSILKSIQENLKGTDRYEDILKAEMRIECYEHCLELFELMCL